MDLVQLGQLGISSYPPLGRVDDQMQIFLLVTNEKINRKMDLVQLGQAFIDKNSVAALYIESCGQYNTEYKLCAKMKGCNDPIELGTRPDKESTISFMKCCYAQLK